LKIKLINAFIAGGFAGYTIGEIILFYFQINFQWEDLPLVLINKS
jgi:hypothetical protein